MSVGLLYNNMSVVCLSVWFPSHSMDLSLQAIDFLFASSIQDGWPLSDIGGDDEGDEDGCTFFRSHLSSRGLSGTLVGHDSIRKKTASCRQFSIYTFALFVCQHTFRSVSLFSLLFRVFVQRSGFCRGRGFT